jgi:hypothetical protein
MISLLSARFRSPGILRMSCSGLLALVLFTARAQPVDSPIRSLAAQRKAGQAKSSDGDPSLQVERDWVDDRWSRTDVGQFLASNLELPDGRVAKSLSIKIGDRDEGAVCFDTGPCAVPLAGWVAFFDSIPRVLASFARPRSLARSPSLYRPDPGGWAQPIVTLDCICTANASCSNTPWAICACSIRRGWKVVRA